MEDSKAQDKVLALGKAIVKELELDPGVDTLAKWMAHYVAEKIELAKTLSGDKKRQAEKDCVEIILKLWQNRWSVPPFKSFMDKFTPLLETLKKLNPNKEAPFFYPADIQFGLGKENKKAPSNETQDYLDFALKVDKLARSIISDLLYRASSELELNDEKTEHIRNVIDLIDYPDTTIINFTVDYDKYLKNQEDEEPDETNEKEEELKRRMRNIEELKFHADKLLDRYMEAQSKLND